MKHKIKLVIISLALLISASLIIPFGISASTARNISLPWNYTFSYPGILHSQPTSSQSGSPDWWVENGQITVANGMGQTSNNDFKMFERTAVANSDQTMSVLVNGDNLSNPANRAPYNGIFLVSRYQDDNNFYVAGIRQDGTAAIKKEVGGTYYMLGQTQVFPGTWSKYGNYDLLPKNTWVTLRQVTSTDANGIVHVALYVNGSQVLNVADTSNVIGNAGLSGIRSDYVNLSMKNYNLADPNPAPVTTPSTPTPVVSAPTPIPAPAPAPQPAPAPVPTPTVPVVSAPTPVPAPTPVTTSYDSVILADHPVMYLNSSGNDLTGNGHNGSFVGGTPASATLPNGDSAPDYNGTNQYMTVPSSPALSIATTKQLTWEAWIRPDTLQFTNDSGYGYVDWMGKCQDYGPTCEWESRIYSLVNPEGRASRLSAYVFNPSAGLGSAADWQPSASQIAAGQWVHVVGEYQTITTPSGCSTVDPGSINIWVDGVKWNMSYHFPTGCMSQYSISPQSNNSPLNIGTMALETWFKGAVGKVAIYNYLLSDAQIANHFKAMTGATPSGSCAETCTIK